MMSLRCMSASVFFCASASFFWVLPMSSAKRLYCVLMAERGAHDLFGFLVDAQIAEADAQAVEERGQRSWSR